MDAFKTLVPVDHHIKFYKELLSPGSLCFDVGANHGEKTAAILAFSRKVIAIEPQNNLVTFLANAFKKEIEKGRLVIVPTALGEAVGIATLYPSADPTQSMSTLSETFLEVSESYSQYWDRAAATQVPVTTLDHLIIKFGMPDYIKIDSEGFDINILKGLTSAPYLISFEYNTAPRLLELAIECINQFDHLPGDYAFNVQCPHITPDALYLSEWVSAGTMQYILERDIARMANFGDIYAKRLERSL